MSVGKEARDWIKDTLLAIPERMPNVDLLYKSGAIYVSVDEYDKESGRMILAVMFPGDYAASVELWLYIANCDNDGVKLTEEFPLTVQLLILGPEEYIDRQALGPNAMEVPIKW